jgi:NTP pyrophosphatase (non-canonical NTP hydrolase)
MNRTEHLLTCLAEECAEVAQRVSKALRFGLTEVQPGQGKDNAERIAEELGDLYAVALILADENVIPLAEAPLTAKREKIERFMSISREQGALSA